MELAIRNVNFVSLVIVSLIIVSSVFQCEVNGGRFSTKRCSWIKCRAAVQECPPGFFVESMRRCRRNSERDKMQLRCCPIRETSSVSTTTEIPVTPIPPPTTTTTQLPPQTFPPTVTEILHTRPTTTPITEVPPITFPTPGTTQSTTEGSLDDSCVVSQIGEDSYVVALIELKSRQTFYHFCGGTIIREDFVLTSASCVKDKTNTIIASAGDLDLNIGEGEEQRVLVDEMFLHPDYNPNDSSQANNIALLRLKWPFLLNDHVAVIPIAKPDVNTESGFGNVTGYQEKQLYSYRGLAKRQRARVEFVSHDDCSIIYNDLSREDQMCATSSSSANCADPGGGLTCSGDNGDVYVCGVSSSPPLSKKRAGGPPTVYTKTSPYSIWIEETMNKSPDEMPTTEPPPIDPSSTTTDSIPPVFTTSETTPMSTTTPSSSFQCQNTIISSYSYLVALVRQQTRENTHFCGGTILNENYLLTAAHCFFHPRTFERLNTSVLAMAGATDLNQFERSLQIVQVKTVIIHKEYDPRDTSQKADIAVLKLTSSLEFNEYVGAAELPPEGFNTNEGSATVVGWDVVELYANTQNSRLQYVNVNIIPDQQCSQVHRLYVTPTGKEKLLPDSQICVTSDEAHSSCPGESGGPLICNDKSVCGVSSIISDYVGIPTVYTDVPYYRSWINDQISTMEVEETTTLESPPEECEETTTTISPPFPGGPDPDPDEECEDIPTTISPPFPGGPDPDPDEECEDIPTTISPPFPGGPPDPDEECEDTTTKPTTISPSFPGGPTDPDEECEEDSSTPQSLPGPDEECEEESPATPSPGTDDECEEEIFATPSPGTDDECEEENPVTPSPGTDDECEEENPVTPSPGTDDECEEEIFATPSPGTDDECEEEIFATPSPGTDDECEEEIFATPSPGTDDECEEEIFATPSPGTDDECEEEIFATPSPGTDDECEEEIFATPSPGTDDECEEENPVTPSPGTDDECEEENPVTPSPGTDDECEEEIFATPSPGTDDECEEENPVTPSPGTDDECEEEIFATPSPGTDDECEEEIFATPSPGTDDECEEEIFATPSPGTDDECEEENPVTPSPGTDDECEEENPVTPSPGTDDECEEEIFATPSPGTDDECEEENPVTPSPGTDDECEEEIFATPSPGTDDECEEENPVTPSSGTDDECEEENPVTPSPGTDDECEEEIFATPTPGTDDECEEENPVTPSPGTDDECEEEIFATPSPGTDDECEEEVPATPSPGTDDECEEEIFATPSPGGDDECEEENPVTPSSGTDDECEEENPVTPSPGTDDECEEEIFATPSPGGDDDCEEDATTASVSPGDPPGSDEECEEADSTRPSTGTSDEEPYVCKNASRGIFSYVVALIYKDKSSGQSSHICAGSLIDDMWAITSASCFSNSHTKQEISLENIFISAGDQNLVYLDGSEQICQIDTVYFPDCYDPTDSSQLCNIALVKLLWPVNFNYFVQPIDLPPFALRADSSNTNGWTAGWDVVELNTNNADNANLMSVQLPILPCPTKYNDKKRVYTASQICTGAPPQRGSCGDDIGAGLHCKNGSSTVLCGVASSATSTARQNYKIYMKVSYFRPWIDKVIQGSGLPATSSATSEDNTDDENPDDLFPTPVSNTTEPGQIPPSWLRCDPGRPVPYQVALAKRDSSTDKLNHFCDAMILNENTLVTAAQCFYEGYQLLKPSVIVVYAGESNLNNFETIQIVEVDKILHHENYSITNPTNFGNIGILRTAVPFEWNQYVSPITLPTSRKASKNFVEGLIGGWGIGELYSTTDDPNYHYTTAPILPDLECLLHIDTLHPESQMCVLNGGTRSACSGYPGGPFTCGEYACGIALRHPPSPPPYSKSKEIPNLFTELAYYLGWLDRSTTSTTWTQPDPGPTTDSPPDGDSPDNAWGRCEQVPNIYIPIQVVLIINLPGSITNLHFCDGAIVTEDIILTSAACLFTPQTLVPIAVAAIQAIAGDSNLNRFDGTEQIVGISDSVIHEHFDINNSTQYANIAFLRTSSPFTFNEYVAPMKFPPKGFRPPDFGSISGWEIEQLYTNNSGNPMMQTLTMPMIHESQCATHFEPFHPESQFCTSPYNRNLKRSEENSTACARYSGGPYMCAEYGCGIVFDHTNNQRTGNSPFVYTNLSYFNEWIDKTLDELQPRVKETSTQIRKQLTPLATPATAYDEDIYAGCTLGHQINLRHQVAIIQKSRGNNSLLCSGTIMNAMYILTAASCLHTLSGQLLPLSELYVYAGDPNLNELDGSEQIIRVDESKIHENYDRGDPNQFCNIALLRLKWSIVFNEFVNPAKLFTRETSKIKGTMGVSGWGAPAELLYTRRGQANAVRLRLSEVNTVHCSLQNINLKDAWKSTTYAGSQICVESLSRWSPCPRDMGSGMFCEDLQSLCAIGSAFTTTGTPANIYTSVPYFQKWIYSMMNQYVDSGAQLPFGGIPSSPKPEKLATCRDASPMEFQFQVALISQTSLEKMHYCEGSLLSEYYVLTAASCLYNELGRPIDARKILVSAGDPNPSTGSLQIIQVEHAIIHENFNIKGSSLEGNIALLKLKWPATLNEYTSTISLPTAEFDISNVEEGTIAGRDNLNIRFEGNSSLHVTHLGFKNCEEIRKVKPQKLPQKTDPDSVVCTSGDFYRESCPRDPGAPLVCNDELRSEQYICGISVPEYQISKTRKPSFIFSSAYFYRSWILHKTSGLDEDSFDFASRITTTKPLSSSTCEISKSSFPYQVALVRKENGTGKYIHWCDGVIFSPEYVLTSAGCVYTEKNRDMWILAGYNDLNQSPGKGQILKVKEVIIHDKFDRSRHIADLAILHLSTKLTFNEYISSAKFSSSINSKGIISGWPIRQLYTKEENSVFQKITVPIIADEVCRQDGFGFDAFSHLCVSIERVPKACMGNIGGPLNGLDGKTVYGIASTIMQYSRKPNSLMVYTDINVFLDWISLKATKDHSNPQNIFSPSSLPNKRPPAILNQCKVAKASSFPFQAALVHVEKSKTTHICGAVIRNTTTLLTAAHCLFKKSNRLISIRNLRVLAGEGDINKLEGTEQTRTVEKLVIHPDYHFDHLLSKNDIALIVLKSPLLTNEYVKGINIPSTNKNFQIAAVAGWQEKELYSQKATSLLQTKNVSIISYEQCRNFFGKILKPNIHICTANDVSSTCVGDDGGPIVAAEQRGKPYKYLLGISTFMSNEEGVPNVYLNVQYYRNWIEGKGEESNSGGSFPWNQHQNRYRTTVSPFQISLEQEQHSNDETCNPAPRQSFSFQVAIVFKLGVNETIHFCSGSLISRQFVLTSASCIIDKLDKFSDAYVVAGDYDLSILDGTEQVIKVSEVIIHEDFDPNNNNQYCDIALLKLKWEVVVNNFVNLIELPPVGILHSQDTRARVAGWERKDLTADIGNPILHVKEVTLKSCTSFYVGVKHTKWEHGDTQICSSSESAYPACDGDFGAPLVCTNNTKRYVCGVSIYQSSNGKVDWHVYTDIISLTNWVEEMMFQSTNASESLQVTDTNPPTRNTCQFAEKASFNFQVALVEWDPEINNYVHFCSGNIIDNSILLTSAHCWVDENTDLLKDVKYIRAVAGDHDLNRLEGSEVIAKIDNVIVHENYDPEDEFQHSDIALAKLKSPLIYDKYISSIALPGIRQSVYRNASVGSVAGWEQTELYSSIGSSILHYINMKTVPYNECSEQMQRSSFKVDPKSHLCLLPVNSTEHLCKGDFGGGYVANGYIWGLGSVFSDGQRNPHIYTNVSNFLDWIKKKKDELVKGLGINNFFKPKSPPTVLTRKPITRPPVDLNLEKCENVKAKQWPFAVALIEKNSANNTHFCGGAIYNSEYVITSASCLHDSVTKKVKMAKNIFIHGGDLNLNVFENSEQKVQARKIFIHGNYDPQDESRHSDIAIIRIKSRFTFNDFVAQAPIIPPVDLDTGLFTTGKVGGYEEIDLLSNKGSPLLRTVEYQLISDSDCEDAYRNLVTPFGEDKVYPDLHICANNGGTRYDCRGDLGGPLICNLKNQTYLCGILSIPSSLEDVPHVYTDVAYHINWIQWITQYK